MNTISLYFIDNKKRERITSYCLPMHTSTTSSIRNRLHGNSEVSGDGGDQLLWEDNLVVARGSERRGSARDHQGAMFGGITHCTTTCGQRSQALMPT